MRGETLIAPYHWDNEESSARSGKGCWFCMQKVSGLQLSSGAGGVILKCLRFSIWWRTYCVAAQSCDALNILLHCNSPQGAENLLEALKALRDDRKTLQILSVGFLPITSFFSNSFFICVYLLYGFHSSWNCLDVKFHGRKKLVLKTFIRLAWGYNLWQCSWILERKLYTVCHSLWLASAWS